MRKLTSRLALLAVLLLSTLLAGAGLPGPAGAVERPNLQRALLATVRVAVPIESERDAYSTGSGTILTEDGLILTNFHVMGNPDRGTLFNRDGVAFVAVNPASLKGLPTWLYQAEVVRADPTLDLAVLKVTGYLEGNDPLPSSLGLVSIDLGNSDQLAIGDELSVIGFPGIGGDTVTFTQGKVSGFLDEDRNNVFEWIKTDAEVNHGNSGGLAIDEAGHMVGVPTAGVSDVEAAGKISLIRPINLARPLVQIGDLPQQSSNCRAAESHPDRATISNLRFAEAVDRSGAPEGVASSFQPGLTTVYGVFDYDRLRNGHDFRFTWYLDGEQVFEDTLTWDGGGRGSDWVNLYSESSLPDGVYSLELRYDDVLLDCDSFSIGTQPTAGSPRIGPFTFATGQQNDQPVGAGTAFPADTSEIYAFFDYAGMADGLQWRQVWYVDGEIGLDTTKTWNGGAAGNYWISVNAENGLPVGDYALELYVDGQLARSGEFTISGTASPVPQGVVVIGTVVDANRRSLPVVGALVIFLKPGTDIQQWARTQSQADVFASGVSDQSGQFQLSPTVQPGESYPVVVLADNYRAVTEQSFPMPADAASPYELDITMVRE